MDELLRKILAKNPLAESQMKVSEFSVCQAYTGRVRENKPKHSNLITLSPGPRHLLFKMITFDEVPRGK